MVNRYDFMTESETADPITGSLYPDPLSLNYLNLQLSSIPRKDKMTTEKIMFFWKEMYDVYGSCEYDDIILTLNGISHKNFLKPEDIIYFPSIADINQSFSKVLN